MLSGVEMSESLALRSGRSVCRVGFSDMTGNKAFDLPAYAERGGEWFLGGANGAGGRGVFVVCVLATCDLKLRAYCFRGS